MPRSAPAAPVQAPAPLTDSMVPKHVQLREGLLRLVREELSPGDALPSERALMARHGVSRATVRRAVGELVSNGLLVSTPGKGTFVTRTRVESQLHLASFTEDMRRRGYEPTSQLLGCRLLEASAPVAAFLGAGAHWLVERVRLADGIPMALETSWYNARLLPGLDQHDLGQLYLLLRDQGLGIDAAEQSVRTELADAATCRALHVEPPAPVMVFVRQSTSAGRPVEYARSDYRGDRYSLSMCLDGTMATTSPKPTTFPTTS